MTQLMLMLRVAYGGAELHWYGRPAGESLQGWYRSKTKARNAAKELGIAIVLEGEKTP